MDPTNPTRRSRLVRINSTGLPDHHREPGLQHHCLPDQRSADTVRAHLADVSLAKGREKLVKVRVTNSLKAEKTEKHRRKMAPRESEQSWRGTNPMARGLVTDEEGTDEETEFQKRQPVATTRDRSKSRVRKEIEPREMRVPKIGDQWLILVGKTGQDIGQQGRVMEIKPVMMEVEYQECHGKKMKVKNKRPSSLLMLENRVEIVRDRKGTLWVRRSVTMAG